MEKKLAKEIADELGISVPTCCEHIRTLYQKLGASGLADCVAKLIAANYAQED